jgi:hypothetical protein
MEKLMPEGSGVNKTMSFMLQATDLKLQAIGFKLQVLTNCE